MTRQSKYPTGTLVRAGVLALWATLLLVCTLAAQSQQTAALETGSGEVAIAASADSAIDSTTGHPSTSTVSPETPSALVVDSLIAETVDDDPDESCASESSLQFNSSRAFFRSSPWLCRALDGRSDRARGARAPPVA